MKSVSREKLSRWIKEKSQEVVIESILFGNRESAMFELITSKYYTEVTLYYDGSVLIQIWDTENDISVSKSNFEDFIDSNIIRWNDMEVEIKNKMKDI